MGQYRATGTPALFEQIMRAYGGMVFSVCFKVTKDAADAEDASQATFLTLAVQCKTGAPITYLGPWLKKVAKRTSLDLVRSRKRRTRREAVTASNRPEHYTVRPAAQSEAGELHTAIRAELEELPSKYRMPLVLHYFGGLSHDEISKEMRCTTAALGVRLHRARKMLGKRLTARGITLESSALGAAIAISIQHVITDRFMHSTQATAAGLLWGSQVFNTSAMAASASLPGNLTAILELVGQVGHSMARARMKMATAALAASISVLGGAAEAVRHLPDSIRPNLEFLAPSQIIQNLLNSFDATPRVQDRPTFDAVKLAVAPPANLVDPDPEVAPTYQYTLPVVAPTNQPVLALQIPPTTTYLQQQSSSAAPASYKLQLEQAAYTQHATATPNLVIPTPTATNIASTTASHASASFVASGGSSVSNSSAGSQIGTRESGGSGADPIPQFGSSSSGFDSIGSYGSSFISPIGQYTGGKRGLTGASIGSSLAMVGPAQIPDTDTGSFTPGSVILQPNDVFVHGGTGVYHWSDSSQAIAKESTNSADFTLSDATDYGVVEIARLPLTTTEAPARPVGHHFVNIWSFSSTTSYDTIRLTAHYDEALAESFGLQEGILKLWVYGNNQWFRIQDSSFSRDMVDHSLTGTYTGGEIQFFAVSAPEPTAIFSTLVLGGFGLLRRRRAQAAQG